MKIGIMLRNLGGKGGIVVYASNQYVLPYQFPRDTGQFGNFPNVTESVLPAPNKLWWDHVSFPRFARRNSIDVIFNPKLFIPVFTRCKAVWVMHGGAQFVVPQVFKLMDRVYFSIANRVYASRADAIITMTSLGARDIIDLIGADAAKVHAIHESYNE